MILTRESRRTWWLVMIGAWVLAAVLATLHAFAMRDYVGLIDRAAARVPPITTPLRHIIPTNYADAQNWVRYALTFDGEAPSRVRYTYNDNAPDGREVHWSSGFAHLVAGAGRLRQGVTGEPLPLATERVLPWFNLPLLMAAVIVFSAWVGRRAGAGAGALVAVGIVGTEGFYGVFAPYYVDHHGLLTAATFGVVLGAIFMGAGWWRTAEPGQDQLLPRSRAAARGAAIFSGACGALGLWISAFSTIPVIALTGFAGLVAAWSLRRVERRDGAEFDADLWRWWGRVGAAGSVAFYLFEYAPALLGMRLEVNHPCYALAWWGGSELVALLAERRLAVVPVAPAWRFVWPGLALAAAPLTVLLGGARVFVVGDPFISEIPKTVAEGLSLAAATKAFGWPTFFHYINGNVAAFAVVAVLLLRRAPSQKPLLVFSAVVALGFLALLAAQIRWSFVASGPLLCLLLVVVAALVQGRSTRVRGLVVLAVGGACFLPGAINRISAVQGRVALRAADQGDLQQLIYRDAAAAIRASQPTGEIVLLASPNGSTGMGYYGNFRTLGTLYWENYRGLRAAAEIFCAPTAERARELIRLHGVTHLALISEENYLAQYFSILHPTGTPEEFKKTFGYTLLSAQVLTPWLRPIPYRVPSEVKIPDLRVLLLQVVPDQTPADALWHIAIAQLTLGESANAVQSFSAAIMQSPAAQQVALCQAAGNLCYERAAHAAAVTLYRLGLTPGDHPVIAGNLAWVLATSQDASVRNGAEAVVIAQRLGTQEPTALSALAAALAEAQRFPEAVAAAERALELIRGTPQHEAQVPFTARLEAYRAGKPWRQ